MSYAIQCPTCRGLETTRIDHYDPEVPCADCDGAGYIPRDDPPGLGEYDMPNNEADFPELVLPESGRAERVVVIQYETDPHDNEAPVLAWVNGVAARAEVMSRGNGTTVVYVYIDEPNKETNDA